MSGAAAAAPPPCQPRQAFPKLVRTLSARDDQTAEPEGAELPHGDEATHPVILCVDDEPMNLELLERSLRRRFEVLSAAAPDHALELLRSRSDIAVVLSDFRMP